MVQNKFVKEIKKTPEAYASGVFRYSKIKNKKD